LLWSEEVFAPGRASEACIELLSKGLAECAIELRDATLFVADVGPGSFTGIRVGIVLAKTCAWNFGVQCAEVDAFDLIDPAGPVAIPAQRGVYFVRTPGIGTVKTTEVPAEATGYGFGEDAVYPSASRVKVVGLAKMDPMALMPKYLAEPSISTPKRPLSRIQV
jgi:tRNA A37 threonylcarbamoyladenosine modification protein TsaB